MAMLNYQRVMVIFGFRYKKLSSSSWGSANWVHARKKSTELLQTSVFSCQEIAQSLRAKVWTSILFRSHIPFSQLSKALALCNNEVWETVRDGTNFQRRTVRPWPSWEFFFFFFCEDCHREKTFQASCLQHPLTDQMHFIIFGPPPSQQR